MLYAGACGAPVLEVVAAPQLLHALICAHVKDTSASIRGAYRAMLSQYPKELWEGDEGSTPALKRFESSININGLEVGGGVFHVHLLQRAVLEHLEAVPVYLVEAQPGIPQPGFVLVEGGGGVLAGGCRPAEGVVLGSLREGRVGRRRIPRRQHGLSESVEAPAAGSFLHRGGIALVARLVWKPTRLLSAPPMLSKHSRR